MIDQVPVDNGAEKDADHGERNWRPAADTAALRLRAELLGRIRNFFRERDVLEVETPLLASTTVLDLHLTSMEVRCEGHKEQTADGRTGRRFFLQTSPESFMKRLLAAGSGPIFQLCKAFRDGEVGPHHNPEFTLLEWYRPGFHRETLMDEVESLVRSLLPIGPAMRMTYRDAFCKYAELDPFLASLSALQEYVDRLGFRADADPLDRDTCLDLIVSRVVQPALGPDAVFLYHFPASQAAMARLAADNPLLAERFELFVDGIELANGYHELADSREQRHRFLADREKRSQRQLPNLPMDERLLAALEHGLPDCAGVALGVDRLLMLLASHHTVSAVKLDAVMAFPFWRV
uniref:Lysyl-tRNA synthetase, class 2 n=1 Tax=Candidatus Kentrum sp. MB TaxID=2138164 RepID=A0A450XLQ8_9GAMM|nr:MAG: lysyl-tRNA synthetase, class 2 [Candidatus Kentron sp. MB]